MKVFLDSVGCRLNQAELEQFAAKFKQYGYEIADSADDAEAVRHADPVGRHMADSGRAG